MEELGINVDVTEDADTFAGNAKKKASEIMKLCGEITLCGRQRSCVDALGGAPGVYSARYSGEGATDLKNNLLLLKNMEGAKEQKSAFHMRHGVLLSRRENRDGGGRVSRRNRP